MIRRIHKPEQSFAAELLIWSTGMPMRKFLYEDFMALVLLSVLDLYPVSYLASTKRMRSDINVGTGTDLAILQPPETIVDVPDFIRWQAFDFNNTDVRSIKNVNVIRLAKKGWSTRILISEKLDDVYRCFLENANEVQA